MSLLIISRIISPQLTDQALSESDYLVEADGPAEVPAMLVANGPGPFQDVIRVRRGCRQHTHKGLVLHHKRKPAAGAGKRDSMPRTQFSSSEQAKKAGTKRWMAILIPSRK
ncbi:hypothetical protein [Hymenobacter yonginensis]|uniref:Uncharacterized protein n=1 Tax=Hymenobacter yonginensis TaxID=748197 RepID=A0ABY7PRB5_9BACT|nr:hypothetical protein [Hymenobacter yonginensis]WBO85410.1 hypothetical protein O9Z63_04010 [Hymenobacter yonginensis]